MPSEFSRALVWLRRDLRLSDHRALAEATRRADSVAVAFVYDTEILDSLPRDDRRLTFIQASLDEVDRGLRAQGSRLLARHGNPLEVIPSLAREVGAEAVFFSHDDDPYALARDAEIPNRLPGVEVVSLKDHLIFERREVLGSSGDPIRVYTPYSRAWKARVTPRDFESEDPDLSRLTPESELPPQRGNLTLDDLGFAPGELWLEPGEAAARTRLEDFRKQIDDYHERRDIPGIEGTSGLSVHLRHGTISIRECFRAAASRSGKGPQKWYDELIWREFYHMILACFPQVVGGTFQPKYADIDWPGTDEHFQAWADGRTGYPIVDAGMRCLKATGWMHNRLRMIAASFLTKDLLVDWRRGEEWFALQLLDFELASNNGGWQWASGTGADAQPYFRIFNPELQSRKFDADGAFIREWVPELAEFSDAEIHAPHKTTPLQQVAAGCRIGEDYPAPIVDHHEQKPKAMALFKFDPEADPVRR